MKPLLILLAAVAVCAAEAPSKTGEARQFVKQGRATAEAALLDRAGEAILDLVDFESEKVRVEILLGREEWRRAAELASALSKKMPDDPHLYALMTDAYLALGDYARAEQEAQFLVDLRRASPAAFLRGAQLREVFGDTNGGMEWFTQAYRLTPAGDAVERARILSAAARMNTSIGRFDLADKYLTQALTMAPSLPVALEALAELRLAEGKPDEAASAAAKLTPSPRALALLARATGEWAEFVKAARSAEDRAVNANRELAMYYAGVGGDPTEAVRIATREYARRQDIATADALAWALFKAGRIGEARSTIEDVVKLGTKDAGVASHARAIHDAGEKKN